MNHDSIKTTVAELFKHLDCTVSSCEISEEDGMLWCRIETPDSRFVLGREGETLKSLNHLVRKMIETGKEGSPNEEESARLYIDVNGYQKKRFDSLKTTAHMMAERARYFKSNIETEPMPAYERRIIHLFLEKAKNIKTESEGQGLTRRVIIKYIEE
jgi:spoIIIJ-associated protein